MACKHEHRSVVTDWLESGPGRGPMHRVECGDCGKTIGRGNTPDQALSDAQVWRISRPADDASEQQP